MRRSGAQHSPLLLLPNPQRPSHCRRHWRSTMVTAAMSCAWNVRRPASQNQVLAKWTRLQQVSILAHLPCQARRAAYQVASRCAMTASGVLAARAPLLPAPAPVRGKHASVLEYSSCLTPVLIVRKQTTSLSLVYQSAHQLYHDGCAHTRHSYCPLQTRAALNRRLVTATLALYAFMCVYPVQFCCTAGTIKHIRLFPGCHPQALGSSHYQSTRWRITRIATAPRGN
jgi:hypothetical protein